MLESFVIWDVKYNCTFESSFVLKPNNVFDSNDKPWKPLNWTKPLNYAKLADIEQVEKETPGKFLDRLREALHKFPDIDPKCAEEKWS